LIFLRRANRGSSFVGISGRSKSTQHIAWFRLALIAFLELGGRAWDGEASRTEIPRRDSDIDVNGDFAVKGFVRSLPTKEQKEGRDRAVVTGVFEPMFEFGRKDVIFPHPRLSSCTAAV
jgi:hypothetical protein